MYGSAGTVVLKMMFNTSAWRYFSLTSFLSKHPGKKNDHVRLEIKSKTEKIKSVNFLGLELQF